MDDLIRRRSAIDALDEIRHALWEIDIPSPTVPEYIEHHEQIQSVWKLLDKKQKELYVLPSAQPERKRGKWIYSEDEYGVDGYHCDKCGFFVPWDYVHKFINYIEDYNYCPNCGADMRGEQDVEPRSNCTAEKS